MINVGGISTKAFDDNGKIRYRFRDESEIRQAVNEAISSRKGQKPIHTGIRGIPSLIPDVDDAVDSMSRQQYLYNKTSGIRIREEMLSVSDDELDACFGEEMIKDIADRFSGYYYYKGFQNSYGVYRYDDDRGKGYDVLYTINSVSFRDGSKYVRNSYEYEEELLRAAKTVVSEVTKAQIPEDDFFDMATLEYYGQ